MKKAILILTCLAVSLAAFANNIAISNVNTTTTGGNRYLNFTVSWDNSWRTSTNPNNWDAAWVFFKFHKNANTAWLHATAQYAGTGTAIDCGHIEPTGATISTPTDGKGIFIYRNADGQGSVNFTNVSIKWNFAADGLLLNDAVTVQAFATEMVYVPQGAFYLGSGGSEFGAFTTAVTGGAYLVNSEAAIPIGTTSGNLTYPVNTSSGDGLGPIPAAYPKGFNAFYCMKYEVSQEQFADFLNTILATQVNTNYTVSTGSGFSIAGVYPNITAATPNTACNYISWYAALGYADWSGLRPMTELEYEKACRGGGNLPVPNEYAWGNTTIYGAVLDTHVSSAGTANESVTAANSNSYSNTNNSYIQRPLRVGAFANANSTRQSAGATYYGIMEMTGNVTEQVISAGTPNSRNFTNVHGDGVLSATGLYNQPTWTSHYGGKGGAWQYTGPTPVSNRGESVISSTGGTSATPNSYSGFRGVRTMP